jgi:hypothetical protein
VLLFSAVVALPACAHGTPPPATAPATGPAAGPIDTRSEEELRTRVERWWIARERRDHMAIYALYEPDYRARVATDAFLKESLIRTRFDILSHRIDRIEPEGPDRARVWMSYDSLVPKLGGPAKGTVEDKWVKVKGVWYKVYEPPALPFPARIPTPPSPSPSPR